MIKLWLLQHVDPDWRVAHKLWSMRVAFVWMVMSGLYMSLPSFQAFLDPFWFAGFCVVGAVLVGVGRLTNQPGIS